MYKLEIKKGGTNSNLRSPLYTWVVMDSNHRSETQQIYSLPHLATLETTLFLSSAKVHFLIETTKNIQKILIRNVEKNRSLYY